ncbi:hypothetical protein WJX84_006336 [Apatococcus fuscideae]|uniref:Uncharacterized protein n=1 Tax=Apatococcus fuscideae TaxID=2026836 RepID=A0AAW1SXH5_9CHLO
MNHKRGTVDAGLGGNGGKVPKVDPEADLATGERLSDEGTGEDAAGQDPREDASGMRRSQRPKGTVKRKENLPVITYSKGESLRELSRHIGPDGVGHLVEVRIAPQFLASQFRQPGNRHLWGTDIYTEDSDLVDVLMHAGYIASTGGIATPPSLAAVRVVVQPMVGVKSHAGSLRNRIRSRPWGAKPDGCSFKVMRCSVVSRTGQVSELEAQREEDAGAHATFMPAQYERAMHTRSAASSHHPRQRPVQEITVMYNLCNEPWLKYTWHVVVDRGLKPSAWTSARLHDEVLLLETGRQRFELARLEPTDSNPADSQKGERFRWARCKQILPMTRISRAGLPLPANLVDILQPSLAWEEIQWGPAGVHVKDVFYPIVRLHWTDRRGPQTAELSGANMAGRDVGESMGP